MVQKFFSMLVVASFLIACSTNRLELESLPLAEYEGLYEYKNDTTLIIVAGPDREKLYADINGARYPLTRKAGDVFLNASNTEVLFVRNEKDKIAGFSENNAAEGVSPKLYSLLDPNETLPSSIWIAKPAGSSSPYAYRAPTDLEDGIAVRKVSNKDPFIDSVETLTNAIYNGAYSNTHSLLIVRNGHLVFEEYFYEFDRDKRHQMRSATKTLMALLAGIAIDEELFSSIEEPVYPWFEDYGDLQNVDAKKRSITLEDLLTMQSGFECNDYDPNSQGNESRVYQSNDWIRYMMDLPMAHEPGSFGAYCSGNVKLIGRMIEKASGLSLKEYADKHLFGPMGIVDYEWDFRPDPSNIDNFTQAWMRPRDMMKIGMLIAQNGDWQGEVIVSEKWIEALRSPQSNIGGTPYGYFYWLRYVNHGDGHRTETPQISGNGGQKIIQLAEHNAIVVMTGGNYNRSSHTNRILVDHVIPALGSRSE